MKKCLIAIALVGAAYCSPGLIAMEQNKRMSQEMQEVIVAIPQSKSAQEILALKDPQAFSGATKYLAKTHIKAVQKKKGIKFNSEKTIKSLKSVLGKVDELDEGLLHELEALNDEAEKPWSSDRIKDILWGLGYLCAAGGTGAGAGYFTLCTSAATASRITGSVSMYTACLGFVYKALQQFEKVYQNSYTSDKINTTLQKIKSAEQTRKELENHIRSLMQSMKKQKDNSESDEIELLQDKEEEN